jgi:Arc/MetJ family transcription regulator
VIDEPTGVRSGGASRIGAVASGARSALSYDDHVIFKRVGDGRPYPDHGLGPRDWAALPPRPVRLDELVTTKDTLQLDLLLDEDSTFFGDLFAHVVLWRDELYLEDGLHRALRAALQQRHVVHARVYEVAG